jgi:hypothetical protein
MEFRAYLYVEVENTTGRVLFIREPHDDLKGGDFSAVIERLKKDSWSVPEPVQRCLLKGGGDGTLYRFCKVCAA